MSTSTSAPSARWWMEPSRRESRRDTYGYVDQLQVRLRHAFDYLVRTSTWALVALIIWVGWRYRENSPLNAEHGVGYALGIVAVLCMSVLLIYPLRKRLNSLRFIGSARQWFKIHMTLGVIAPIAALYHANFQVGSANSQIALYCALVVAGSGLIGRFLYRRIYADFSGQRGALKNLNRLDAHRERHRMLGFLALVQQRLDYFDDLALAHQRSLWTCLVALVRLRGRARRERLALTRFSVQQLHKRAHHSSFINAHQHRLISSLDRYLHAHMLQVQHLALKQIYERLFALWHVAHLPFFFLLLVSVIVHVFAVHMY